MKRGFAIIALALVFGVLIIIGSGYLTARFLFNKNSNQNPKNSAGESAQKDSAQRTEKTNGKLRDDSLNLQAKESTDSGKNQEIQTTTFIQPQNLYTIILPAGWVVNSTTAVNNYSTTKFTGNEGNISITFGSGKDPAGGCSETSSIVLADRTISGCFLLQKDGSKLLGRGYSKTKSGLEITIEAYMNSPNALNSPTILGSIKTIDIN